MPTFGASAPVFNEGDRRRRSQSSEFDASMRPMRRDGCGSLNRHGDLKMYARQAGFDRTALKRLSMPQRARRRQGACLSGIGDGLTKKKPPTFGVRRGPLSEAQPSTLALP